MVDAEGTKQVQVGSITDRSHPGSGPELVRALSRVDEVRNLAIDDSVSAGVPRSRVLELARFAATAKAGAIERMPKERRAATLVALISTLEATAQDDAVDVLNLVLTDLFSDAVAANKKARLRPIPWSLSDSPGRSARSATVACGLAPYTC